MQAHDFLATHLCEACDLVEILAVIDRWHFLDARHRSGCRVEGSETLLDDGYHLRHRGDGRIEEHEKGTIGRDGLDIAWKRSSRQRLVQRSDGIVEVRVDAVSELHHQAPISGSQKPRGQLRRDRTSTPFLSNASRTRRALSSAVGLSPWRQSVSASSATRVPSCAVTLLSDPIETAWLAARSGSVMTEPAIALD